MLRSATIFHRLLGCLMFCLVLAATCWLSAAEIREWTDSTGKHKMKASFVKLADGEVTLLQDDGEELVIPLNKLSKADQDFVTKAMATQSDSPFKPKAASPFKTKKKPVGTQPKPETTAPADDEGETRAITVDLNAAEEVPLLPPGDNWTITVPTDIKPIEKPKPAKIPAKSNFFEGLKGMAVNTTARRVAVGYVLGEPKPEGVSRVAICDLATGKCSAPQTASGQLVPVALHDDGKQVVMRREEFGFGKQDRLEVWTVAGGVKRHAIWTPYDSSQGSARDVMWAEFLDAEHLATSSRGGTVVIWKYPELESETKFQMSDGAVPGLSPDRKWIAYSDGKMMGIFDVATRQVVAQQAAPAAMQWPYMAFSPSSKRLACVAFHTVYVWDVATGKLERTIPCDGINVHGGIEFPDENFILAGDNTLIELQYSVKLWNYHGHEQVRCRNGWAFFAVTDGDKPGTLAATKLPHPAATEVLNSALQDPNLFVLNEGTSVRLNCSQLSDPAQRAAAEAALTKGVEAANCKVSPDGKIELMAMIEGPKEREISFIAAGSYKIKEYISRVRYVYDGKTVWETAGSNVPGIVTYNRDENIETALRKSEVPNYAFFGHVQLPRLIQKQPTLGTSTVTPNGFQ